MTLRPTRATVILWRQGSGFLTRTNGFIGQNRRPSESRLKRSQVLAISVLALMLLAALPAALPVQQSWASSAYSEKLNVFIAGSSAYWYLTFTGVNGSSKLTQFEASPGLSWYNVTAIKTTKWTSDFQIFGSEGYNLLPVPFTPSQGLFLTLSSDNYSDALAAAGRLDAYLMSSFVSLSNSSGLFEFYSPVSFTNVVQSTLLTLVPSSMGGFESAISVSNFSNTRSPFVTFQGMKGSSGFSHNLVVGSISNEALDTQNRPNLLTYFGTNITSLKAATKSSSSTIQIHVLDGVLSSKDNATVINNTSQLNFNGSYTLNVAASKKVIRINATVLQQPLQLLAYRTVDVGVLKSQNSTSIAISLTNLSNTTALDNVTFTDNWWNASLFKFVESSPTSLFKSGGNSVTFFLPIMTKSQSITPTYVLQYIGSVSESVTIPAEEVQFAYTMDGSTFKGHSWLNPITIWLGEDNPAIYAYVAPTGNATAPVGAKQSFSLVVTNVGTLTASSVVVNGQQIGGLRAEHTMTVPISQTANGLLGTNFTKSYLVTYLNAEEVNISTITNVLSLEFTHSGMKLGFATVVVSANLAPLRAGSTVINLTLSFTVTNIGSAGISNFTARVPIPLGLGCGVTNGTGISCASNLLTLNYTSLAANSPEKTSMKFNVTNPANYFFPPLSFGGTTAGIGFTGNSSAFAVPTGYVLTKQFSPSLLFSGVNSTVFLSAVNKGPFYVYNASISSTVDTFDNLLSSAETSASSVSIAPGDNLSTRYGVTATTAYGNHTSSAISATIFFGGNKFSLEGLGPYVSVYRPLNATITTTPSIPTEGKDFNFVLKIHNPTAVNVTSVLFTLPVPSGLTLSDLNNASISNGILTVSISSLLSHSNYEATGVAVASSGTTVSLDKADLTFSYKGVTIKGATPTQEISIKVNVTSRYLIPIAIAIIALLAVSFYVRRMAASNAPVSPK